MCLDTVDGASSSSSTIWQTHNSPPVSAISTRSRFASANAFVMSNTSRIHTYHISPINEI